MFWSNLLLHLMHSKSEEAEQIVARSSTNPRLNSRSQARQSNTEQSAPQRDHKRRSAEPADSP